MMYRSRRFTLLLLSMGRLTGILAWKEYSGALFDRLESPQ